MNVSCNTIRKQGKKIRSGMTNGLAFWDPQEQTANQTRIICINIYIERETSIQSNLMVYARKCKRNSSNARLRASIDLGYDLLDTKSIDFSIEFSTKKKKKKKKIEMTKDVSMLVRVTYSVVDAFQAHRPSPFALSPCPLAPSLSPKQRELDRSRCIRRN